VLLALTAYETALLAVAALFISFALTVALVIPRSRPEFPGRRLGIFVAVCIGLFAAQMTAVLVLAEIGEGHEPVHAEATPTEPTETTPTETTTETSTEPTTETNEAQGDQAAGKTVFASAGCASCHTLADAGATAAVGPNLDATSPPHDKVVERVTNGLGVMPPFKDTLSEQQIQDVAAYVSSVAGS